MMRLLVLLILLPLGFLLGMLAAIGVLFTLGLERLTHALSGSQLDNQGVDFVFSILEGFIGLAGAATVIPALLLVVIGEVARIRSWIFYVGGAGLAAAVIPMLAASGNLGTGNITQIGAIWPVFATAGFAGGFIYWLIAGRTA